MHENVKTKLNSQKQYGMKNNELFGVKGVAPFFNDKEELGCARISRFEFKEKDDFMYNLRVVRDGGSLFRMYDGDYCRLSVNGQLMMSDTAMERKSNRNFINNANGRVLIAGLGLGMIIHNIIDKEEVTEVVVIEKYEDVISLVEPKFKHPKLKVIHADIFDWKPEKGEKFDTIYFDIWADIGTDNLSEMKTLHNKFKFNLNRTNPNAFMDSWLKDYLKGIERKEKRNGW